MGSLTGQAHRRLAVRTDEDVGALRRAVAAMAGGAGVRAGPAELVATELAANLVRHAAEGGYVLLRQGWKGIELIAVDHGPGIPPGSIPPRRVTGGAGQRSVPVPGGRRPDGRGLGVGLASARRQASVFDCYSGPRGSVVLARIGDAGQDHGDGFRWGGVNVPMAGAGESGDNWAVVAGQSLAAMVVDGLGHGPAAAAAAAAAVAAFGTKTPAGPAAYLLRAHEAMRGTRGGVLAACLVDPATDELSFGGVGNISGLVVLDGHHEHLISRGGTVGTGAPAPQARMARYRWGPGAALILATDGLRSRWDPLAYPGLLRRDPAVIAATLHRDHQRGTDDASVLVVTDAREDPR